jgi:hypothetical protein
MGVAKTPWLFFIFLAGRLLSAYGTAGVCDHPAPQISGICEQLNTFQSEFSGAQSMSFSRLEDLSTLLRSLPETGLTHTYEVDRWDHEGTPLSKPERNAASYFLETDNLSVWLPGQVDRGRCRDRLVAGESFLSSVASQRPAQENPERTSAPAGNSSQ